VQPSLPTTLEKGEVLGNSSDDELLGVALQLLEGELFRFAPWFKAEECWQIGIG
jgi:hypothetical protein